MGELDRPAPLLDPKSTRDYVYVILSLVPQGYTITYSALGQIVAKHPRAIAAYMRANRFPIVIPCHRVVSSKGLGGYSLGVHFKQKLLELEGAVKAGKLVRVITRGDELFKVAEREGFKLDIQNWEDDDQHLAGDP